MKRPSPPMGSIFPQSASTFPPTPQSTGEKNRPGGHNYLHAGRGPSGQLHQELHPDAEIFLFLLQRGGNHPAALQDGGNGEGNLYRQELKALLHKPNTRKCDFSEYRNWVTVNLLLNNGYRAATIRNIKLRI